MDITEICLDEIALEGLDGITVPTLWLRLENRHPPVEFQLNSVMKEYLWNFIAHHEDLRFYNVPKNRLEPQIFDRFDFTDDQSVRIASAPDELGTLKEVYSSTPVTGASTGIRGSCSDYSARVDVSFEVISSGSSLNDVIKKYGCQKFVIVASQRARERSLLSPSTNPKVITELNEVAYCVLERLGRSRWQGDLQAVLNKQVFIEKSYHIHYIMIKLYKLGLVVKNPYTYKRAGNKKRTFFQVILHLPRFGRDCRSKLAKSMDLVQETLRTSPDYTMNLAKIKDYLNMEDRSFKTLYSNMAKSGIVTVRNIDPSKRAKHIREKIMTLVIKFDEEEEFEDDDILGVGTFDNEPSPMVFEEPLVRQSFAYVLDKGTEGITQRDMLAFLKGFGKLEARNICRMFERSKLVKTILIDCGRQRSQKLIPIAFAQDNINTKQFSDEKEKMQQLLSESSLLTSPVGNASELEYASQDDSVLKEIGLQENLPDLDVSMPSSSMKPAFCNSTIDTDSVCKKEVSLVMNEMNTDSDSLQALHTPKKKWDANLTARKMKRHNTILETLKRCKVIEGVRTLQNILSQVETLEGVKSKIDKKTVHRLVMKMHEDGLLKFETVPIPSNGTVQNIYFITSLDCDPRQLKNAIEEAKCKIFNDGEIKAARTSIQTGKSKSKDLTKTPEDENSFMEYQPKFKKLQAVHELLWYLSYGHPVKWKSEISKKSTLKEGSSSQDKIASTEKNLDNICVYNDEYSWKRYLPPIPTYKHCDLSWLQLGDVTAVLPLSVLCQFHRIDYKVEGLQECVTDHDKRFHLVCHLPSEMRSFLLYKRKYLFSLISCIEQLAFMGLVSMKKGGKGASVLPKETLRIYVHRNISLLDTRGSSKQHMKVENRKYDRILFLLDNFGDVQEYWERLGDICLSTRLGYTHLRASDYNCMRGHLGAIQLKKFCSLHFRQDKDKDTTDDAAIPGDNRGAAGLDSSMYSHMYRNWTFATSAKRKAFWHIRENEAHDSVSETMGESSLSQLEDSIQSSPIEPMDVSTRCDNDETLEPSSQVNGHTNDESADITMLVNSPPALQIEDDTGIEVKLVNNIGRNSSVKGGKGVKRKQVSDLKETVLPAKKAKKDAKGKRITNIATGDQKVRYADDVDLEALAKRGRGRVHFTSAEDYQLLLCHVAATLLAKIYRMKGRSLHTQQVPWSVTRDVLQATLPESKDKTSFSLHRRSLFLLKSKENEICCNLCLTDSSYDKQLMHSLISRQPERYDVNFLCETFCELVLKLHRRLRTQPGLYATEILRNPSQIETNFNTHCIIPRKKRSWKYVRKEVKCTKNIVQRSIENVIYACLYLRGGIFDHFQAFKVLNRFSELPLGDVFERMRNEGCITTKLAAVGHYAQSVPSHFLTQSHSRTFSTFIPPAICRDISEFIDGIVADDHHFQLEVPLGQVFVVSQMFLSGAFDLQIELPEEIILPDLPKTSFFENQFLMRMKEAQVELEKSSNCAESINQLFSKGLQASASLFNPSSVMEDSANQPSMNMSDEENPTTDDPGMCKLAEVIKLYRRHPSYTNWLLLNNPGKLSEAKFKIMNYSLNTENVVLTPCKIWMGRSQNVLTALNSVPVPDNEIPISIDNMAEERSAKILHALTAKQFHYSKCEAAWNEFLSESTNSESDDLRTIFQALDEAGDLGLIESDVESQSPNILKTLIAKGVIWRVGSCRRRYVLYKHLHPWITKGIILASQRSGQIAKTTSSGGRRRSKSNEVPSTDGNAIGTISPRRRRMITYRGKVEDVDFLCRPWHTLDGKVNYTVVKTYIMSVFLKVMSSPGVSLEDLENSFDSQPICILELIQTLCEFGCLIASSLEFSCPKSLFGAARSTTKTFYEVTEQGLIILSFLCQYLGNSDKDLYIPIRRRV